MSQKDLLLQRVKSRTGSGRFGYGVATADRYVKHALETLPKSLALTMCGGPALSFDNVLKHSANKLTYCGEHTKQEQLQTGIAAMQKVLGVVPPKHAMMAIVNRLTTPREDRDGDTLQTAGARLDPKAPMLWQHLHTAPIGKMMRELEKTAEILRVASVLLDINETTHDAGILFEAEALRFSHGFIPMKFEERKGGPMARFNILEFDIVEESAVSVPSNVDAEVELFSRGKLSSNLFKAHAKALFDERRKIMPVTSKAKAAVGGKKQPDMAEPAERPEDTDLLECKGCGKKANVNADGLCEGCADGGKSAKSIGTCEGCGETVPLDKDGYCKGCAGKKGATNKEIGACEGCGETKPLNGDGMCSDCAGGDEEEAEEKGVKEIGECSGCGENLPLNEDGKCKDCAEKPADEDDAPPMPDKTARVIFERTIALLDERPDYRDRLRKYLVMFEKIDASNALAKEFRDLTSSG
jgi:hypothetical protein